VKRIVVGLLIALGTIALLGAAMMPLRGHLSVATPALVLVVPVVAGAAVGGLWAGALAAATGFVVYDLLFIPPYGTLAVGAVQNWAALGVYAVVVLMVAGLVATLQRIRGEAARHDADARQLYVLSDLLIGDKHVTELLQLIVSTVHQAFGPRWVVVLLPAGETLSVVATAADPLSEGELASLAPAGGRPESLQSDSHDERVVKVVLTARGRPVGMMAMAGTPLEHHDGELLRTYANQAALALERSQLREQALRAELLEEVGRWRDALVGAVSHDLRTPLASVKTAVTALQCPEGVLSPADRAELLALIEAQSDTLDRLVANLLDMSRIQSGTLELRRTVGPVADVVEGARRVLTAERIVTELPPDLPPVDVDQLLMEQALANLVENALRHSPDGGAVEVSATADGQVVELAVRDHGPGVPAPERERVFEMFNQVSGGGRAGLGLAIAKAFVEAHDQAIRVEDAPGGGARFVFTMPTATVPPDAG